MYIITIVDYNRNTVYVHSKTCSSFINAKYECESLCKNCEEEKNGINLENFGKFYKKGQQPNNRGPSYYYTESHNINCYKVKVKHRFYGYLYNDIVIKKFLKCLISYFPDKGETCSDISNMFCYKDKFDDVLEDLLIYFLDKNKKLGITCDD